MRIAPMIIPHLGTATADLWVDTALCVMMTHNDSGSTSVNIGIAPTLLTAEAHATHVKPGTITSLL